MYKTTLKLRSSSGTAVSIVTVKTCDITIHKMILSDIEEKCLQPWSGDGWTVSKKGVTNT